MNEHRDLNAPCIPPKILHTHCFQFLLGITVIPRQIQGNDYAKFWGVNQVSYGVLTICIENPDIPGRIQLERFNPVEILGQKSNTFRGITFSPFLPKRPKLSVPFVWITSAKRKVYRYFVNGTTQSRSCFQCQKKYQYHLTEIFLRHFRNGKRSWSR